MKLLPALYLGLVVLAGSQSSSLGGVVPLARDSPLATNRMWLFAVAADGKTILRQSLADEGPWRIVPTLPGVTRVTGLTATEDTLFVADGPGHRILSVDLASNKVGTYAVLPPTFEPADLAYTGSLFFADRRQPNVYALEQDGDPRPLATEPSGRSASSKHIASSGRLLLMSSADDGTVWQASTAGRTAPSSNPFWQAVQRPSSDRPGPALPFQLDILVPGQVSFPLRPTSIATNAGVIYVVDGNTKHVFAYSRSWPRPVRVHFGPRPVATPARIAATAHQLLILDASKGSVERWPRFVPTRVSCAVTAPANSEPGEAPCVKTQYAELTRFFRYLNSEQYLPTRPLAASGEFSAVTMRNAMRAIVCGLQGGACGAEAATPPANAIAPDVYAESYVDAARVRLSGKNLGRVADEAILSPQFTGYQTEGKLAELNGSLKLPEGGKYRNVSEGLVSVPIELVRMVVGLPDESIRIISARFPLLSFVPLGETAAARSASSGAAQPPADLDRIKQTNAQLVKRIGGPFTVTVEKLPYVGVSEHDIDIKNLDLAESFGGMLPVRANATPTAAASAGVVIRAFKDDDHGTAVASIIAGKPLAFETPALAAGALLLAISDAEPGIGESIRQAYVNQRARIFNLSFHFGPGNVPASLKEKVEQYPDVLFVVAAGNQNVSGPDGNVCAQFEAYPVCWGDKSNVLVVTASTLDGSGMLLPDTSTNPVTPGANWHPSVVHVAAPGEGFYASGRDNSYVPVRGSSFATPIVTATAAVLYGKGIRTPWEIKQRILTTADRVAGLEGRVAFGLLNAKRAVTNLPFAVVVNQLKQESSIALHDVGDLITFATSTENFTVALSNIRRLTRGVPGKYSLVYVDKEVLKRVEVVQGTWPFKYFELDSRNRHKGGVKTGNLSDYLDYVGPIL